MVLDALDELATGFEGCEKKVEIDFHLSSPTVDLRRIPRTALDSILDLARCTIISSQHNADFDAYVLSESSLFVYPSKIMLKTCGTTLLLKCVSALLSAARSLGALPDFLQFSRSNFLFPSKQHFPHRAFNEETDYLNEQLGIAGDAFILGSLNGARWHLYIWDFNELPASEYQQQTLEIVMFNLNTDRMKTFYNAGQPNALGIGHPCGSGEEATRVSGIDRLLPGSVIDSHLFTPCGYSCNGRVDVKDIAALSGKTPASATEAGAGVRVGKQGKLQQAYFTVHITPEPECSFVSFETNAVLPSYTALVRHVVELFQPGSFCVSLFVDGGSDVSDSRSGLSWEHPGYVTKGTTHHAFEAGYNATVSQFEAVRPDHLHLAPQFGAHALNNEPTGDAVHGEEKESGDEGAAKGTTPTLAGVVMPFSSPRASPLSAHLVLSGLNGLPSSYETVTSLSQEQMRAVTLEIAKQRYIDVQTLPSAVPTFTLNGEAEGGVAMHSVTSSSSALLTAARGVMEELAEDVGFSVVDLGALVRRFYQWSQAFPRVEPMYTVHGTALPAGIALALSALGCHFAVRSASTLQNLLALSVPASRVVFQQPLKSRHQLQSAHGLHVDFVTASSTTELRAIGQVHGNAKVVLHVAGDGEAIGFSEAHVSEALALARDLDLGVVGVTVGGAGLPTLCKRAAAVLQRAAKDGQRLSMVLLADLPASAFTNPSPSLSALLESSFGADVRVLADSRAFFDDSLALTAVRVLAASQPGPGQGAVAYVHPSVGAVLSSGSRKRCRLEAFGDDGGVADAPEHKEGTDVRCVPRSAASEEEESGVVAAPCSAGGWLQCYPVADQLERMCEAATDAVRCYYIAS